MLAHERPSVSRVRENSKHGLKGGSIRLRWKWRMEKE